MANFFHILKDKLETLSGVFPTLSESVLIAIPARPSTSELAEDLLVDPEALKLETHEPGIYDETGDYIPQFSDDPKDLEMFGPTPLDAPQQGDTAPESVPAEVEPSSQVDESSKNGD